MLRALLVIEGICLQDVDFHTYTKEQLDKLVSDIYCIAHSATGKCCNGGDKFYRVLEANEKYLKDARIMDVEKCMNKENKA